MVDDTPKTMPCSIGDAPLAACLLLDGSEDPDKIMRRGGVELMWCGGQRITAFRERPLPHVVDASLALPTLYLHMLPTMFFPRDGDMNSALRSGNDNSEIVLVLPERYVDEAALAPPQALAHSLSIVLAFLRTQGEVQCSSTRMRSGGFGPNTICKASADVRRLYYRFNTSRPKCAVTLDRSAFGIPSDADLYLFCENHMSMNYMPDRVRDAFDVCIQELPSADGPRAGDLHALATFCKVFYEGGFAYNKRVSVGSSGYFPVCVGIGALGVTPSFHGQAGIATGYPYVITPQFFRYLDTVPVSITAIASMSERHGRYGISFTRCVFVWDGGALDSEGKLDFCAPAPHGGFFYVPRDPLQYQSLGGLLYAFGEAKEKLEAEVCTEAAKGAGEGAGRDVHQGAARGIPDGDRRVCVICMSADATFASTPCGHRAYCAGCCEEVRGARQARCPVCRAAVSSVIRVY